MVLNTGERKPTILSADGLEQKLSEDSALNSLEQETVRILCPELLEADGKSWVQFPAL